MAGRLRPSGRGVGWGSAFIIYTLMSQKTSRHGDFLSVVQPMTSHGGWPNGSREGKTTGSVLGSGWSGEPQPID